MSKNDLIFVLVTLLVVLTAFVVSANWLAIKNWWIVNYCRVAWGLPKLIASAKHFLQTFFQKPFGIRILLLLAILLCIASCKKEPLPGPHVPRTHFIYIDVKN